MIHISRMCELAQTQTYWVITESDQLKHMQYFNRLGMFQSINMYWARSLKDSRKKHSRTLCLCLMCPAKAIMLKEP